MTKFRSPSDGLLPNFTIRVTESKSFNFVLRKLFSDNHVAAKEILKLCCGQCSIIEGNNK